MKTFRLIGMALLAVCVSLLLAVMMKKNLVKMMMVYHQSKATC